MKTKEELIKKWTQYEKDRVNTLKEIKNTKWYKFREKRDLINHLNFVLDVLMVIEWVLKEGD